MVPQPVEERAGEAFGAEHAGPFVERQLAGDQRAAAFVALAQDLEQEFGADRGERYIAKFVNMRTKRTPRLAIKSIA